MSNVTLHGDLADMLVDADTLSPHPRNARAQDIDAIVESIIANGVYRPLYVQRSTHYILAGNHTYQALLSLGLDRVPVLFIDVDDATALRIMLADNRIPDTGRYDDGLLVDILADLAENDSLLGSGYVSTDVDALLESIRANEPSPFVDVDVDERMDYRCPRCTYEWNGEPRPASP